MDFEFSPEQTQLREFDLLHAQRHRIGSEVACVCGDTGVRTTSSKSEVRAQGCEAPGDSAGCSQDCGSSY